MASILRLGWLFIIFIMLTACSSQVVQDNTPTHTLPSPSKSPQASTTPTSQPSSTPTKTEILITPTNTPVNQVCSPLDGISIAEISDTIVNPYYPPRIGSDDPHQGVDFAHRLDGNSIALEGFPVTAVLDGHVAAVIYDRFPYGNAVMIETPLEDMSVDYIDRLQMPTPAPTQSTHPALTCPKESFSSPINSGKRSLYLLYAHLQDAAPYELGDEIQCGQALGATGDTGNALNPHMHLEMRVGPSGVRFQSMAHYDTSATADEMAAYCVWRVSDLFQLLDPMHLLE